MKVLLSLTMLVAVFAGLMPRLVVAQEAHGPAVAVQVAPEGGHGAAMAVEGQLSEHAKAKQDAYAHMTLKDRLINVLKLCGLGFVIVMVVLWLIAIVVSILNNQEIKAQEAEARAQAAFAKEFSKPAVPAEAVAAAAAVAVASGAAAPASDDETMVIITAAVAAALAGQAFRIRGVQIAANTGWNRLGRQVLHTSHAVRK